MSSKKTSETKARSAEQQDWRWIRSRFPVALSSLALQTHAFCFGRKIPSVLVLLRLLLLWSLTGWGLRSIAAWSTLSGWADVSADSLRYRFRNAEAFLSACLLHLLQHWIRVAPSQGVPLRLIDATAVVLPGPSGRYFRLHAVYDPRLGVLRQIELTTVKDAESLARAKHQAGDLLIADRGLAKAKALLSATCQAIYWIVRIHLSTIKLYDEKDKRVDLQPDSLCRQADQRRGALDRDVWIKEGKLVRKVRLLVFALPKEKAEQARNRVRKKRSKADPTAIKLAGYVMVLTNLPVEVASAEAVLQWYRVRWQIELYFKRCKSLLGLSTMVSACEQLQRVRILTFLVVASLVDQKNVSVLEAIEPLSREENQGFPSLWRWTQLHHQLLLTAVAGGTPAALRQKRLLQTAHRLQDRPRNRHRLHARHNLDSIDFSCDLPEQVAA